MRTCKSSWDFAPTSSWYEKLVQTVVCLLLPSASIFLWHNILHTGEVAKVLAKFPLKNITQLIWHKPNMLRYGRGAPIPGLLKFAPAQPLGMSVDCDLQSKRGGRSCWAISVCRPSKNMKDMGPPETKILIIRLKNQWSWRSRSCRPLLQRDRTYWYSAPERGARS